MLGCTQRLPSAKTVVTYLLVRSPSNHPKPSDSTSNHRSSPTWRQVDSSHLNLSNRFTKNVASKLPPKSKILSPSIQLAIDVEGSDKKSDLKLSLEVMSPPTPPGPEDCCMSGCATCVYDIYAQESDEYLEFLKRKKILDQNITDPSKNQEANLILTEAIDTQAVLNKSLQAFAEFEKRLRQ